MNIKYLVLAVVITVSGFNNATAATTVDNTTWDASTDAATNNGWFGSGQSLTVDAVDNTLDSIGFFFDAASVGQTFDFSVSSAVTGGTTFFSTSVLITEGLNTINVGTSLLAGSTIFALFDYNGFSGKTAHFNNLNGYAGGHSLFKNTSAWNSSYTGLDHRFIAEFSSVSAVPIPAALFMFAPALLGFMGFRRKAKNLAA